MELGNVVLRRSSINSLFKAVHSRHGLAWTDGQNVFLSPVTVQDENLIPSEPIKLGEFDSIQSLCWSCDFSGGWCYLCVTQYQKVSIWRVEGVRAQLKLKLVRKISKNPLPQGCLWNPVRDILAIVTSEQCNLYFRHSDKKSSMALPIQTHSNALRCACWSDQGDRLYVATKSTVWIFSWANIDHKIKEFSSEETLLMGREGNILKMVAIGKDYLLLTKELPLDKLCTQESLTVDMEAAMISPTDTLMNLTAAHQGVKDVSSTLALVSTSGSEVKVVSETSLVGLLSPDLLSYSFDGKSQLVVVGSNAQSTLHFFTVSGLGTFIRQHDIMLPDSERPKGLCKSSLPQSVLILIGKLKTTDSALPSADKDAEYELKLSLTQLYPSEVHEPPVSLPSTLKASAIVELSDASDLAKVNNTSSSSDSADLNSVLVRNGSKDQLKLNMATASNNQSNSSYGASSQSDLAAVKESGHASNYFSNKIQNNVNEGSGKSAETLLVASMRNITKSDESSIHNHVDADDEMSIQSSTYDSHMPTGSRCVGTEKPPLPVDAGTAGGDAGADILELTGLLQSQESTISRLRKRVDELSCILEECHLTSVNRYQDLSSPEVASITFTSSEQSIEKKFLLDRGRLKLEALKAAFDLPYIILDLDGLPIVLTSNIDGYIPLKFEANQTYYVSCDAASQVAGFSQTTLSNQRTNYKSLERNDMELPLANGSISSPLTADHSDLSRESTTKNKLLSAQNSDSERLRAMILNDKSGNAMRRLQAAVAGDVSAANRLGKQTSLPAEYVPSEEPVKPPRRGVGSKPARCNRPEDTSDGGSSFMDVTAAL